MNLSKEYEKSKGNEEKESDLASRILDITGQNQIIDSEISKFYLDRIINFTNDDYIGYIYNAIVNASKSKDVDGVKGYLKEIVNNPDKYKIMGTLLGTAANQLGDFVKYPDHTLIKAFQINTNASNAREQRTLRRFAALAFGAHVAGATDFEYGLRIGESLQKSDQELTLDLADKYIEDWGG